MCFSFKEIYLRSVSLPLFVCKEGSVFWGGRRTCVSPNVTEAMNHWIQFTAVITLALLLIVGHVHKLTTWLLCIVMRISKWHFPLLN